MGALAVLGLALILTPSTRGASLGLEAAIPLGLGKRGRWKNNFSPFSKNLRPDWRKGFECNWFQLER